MSTEHEDHWNSIMIGLCTPGVPDGLTPFWFGYVGFDDDDYSESAVRLKAANIRSSQQSHRQIPRCAITVEFRRFPWTVARAARVSPPHQFRKVQPQRVARIM